MPNTLNIQHISTDNADEMSIISQTESLTLSQHYASASKRQKYSSETNRLPHSPPWRSNPAFVNFYVETNVSPMDIKHFLFAQHTKKVYDDLTTDGNIHFSIIPSTPNLKQAHIQTPSIESARHLTTLIKASGSNTTNAHPSLTPPMTGTSMNHIDTTLPLNTSFPGNCRIIGCHLHCMEPEQYIQPTNITHIKDIEVHGKSYHSDLLNSTPSPILTKIGWHKCVVGCNNLAFTITNHRDHQANCAPYQQTINKTMDDQTTILLGPSSSKLSPTTLSTNKQTHIHHLRQLCPSEFLREFDEHVKMNTNIKSSLTTLIMGWMIESSTHTTEVSSKKND